jgi:hypothetical protein
LTQISILGQPQPRKEKQTVTNKDNPSEAETGATLPVIGITRINFNKPPKALSKVLEEIAPEGEKVKVVDLVDQDIVIHSIRPFEGQFGTGAYVIGTFNDGTVFNTIIGQRIVLPKLLACMDELPVACKIVKHEGGQFGRYYDVE